MSTLAREIAQSREVKTLAEPATQKQTPDTAFQIPIVGCMQLSPQLPPACLQQRLRVPFSTGGASCPLARETG